MGRFTFAAMTQQSAAAIANEWKYEGIYAFYDMDADPEDYEEIMSPEKRGGRYFEARMGEELAGFFAIERNGDAIEIGLGLKPELCGQERGVPFLLEIEAYVSSRFPCAVLLLDVAEFNRRAIQAYRKAGYAEIKRENRQIGGRTVPFVRMAKTR